MANEEKLTMKEELENVAKPFMFEKHTPELREEVIDAFYAHLNANIHVKDFSVVCDENNNPEEVVNANQLRVDIAIQENGCEEFVYYPLCIMPSDEVETKEAND